MPPLGILHFIVNLDSRSKHPKIEEKFVPDSKWIYFLRLLL